MPIAYKEWAVTVRALAEGEQLLTLRTAQPTDKDGKLKFKHPRFFLYPTFDMHRSELVRESHQPELERSLEEGVWTDGEPSPLEVAPDGSLPQPDRIRIRAWAEVAEYWTITDRRIITDLAPFHVWNQGYAERRLGWRRRDPLHVIMLRTYRIPRPVTVRVQDEYATPDSWAQITRELPFEGTPVLSDGEFDRAAEAISDIVSASDRTAALA